MACSTGCRTKDHRSYGECVRSKGVRVPAIPVEAIAVQKKADRTLDEYAKARKSGIQPSSTRPSDVETAVRFSEATGTAFQG